MDIATPFATPIPGVSTPTTSDGTDWNTILTAVGIVFSLVLLWAGFEKIEFSSPMKALVSLMNVALLIAGIIGLGWPGAYLAGGVSLLAILSHSIWLAIQHDDILTNAAVQGNSDKTEIKALAKRLQSSGDTFMALGPIRTAQLINYLSMRARKPSEIEHMAPAIGALWVIFRPDLETFVGKFDRLMRLAKEPPERAMRVADMLTTTKQRSPASFDEILDGMIAVYDPSPH